MAPNQRLTEWRKNRQIKHIHNSPVVRGVLIPKYLCKAISRVKKKTFSNQNVSYMKQDKNFCPFFSAPLFAKGRQSLSWLPRTHVNRTKSIWFEKKNLFETKSTYDKCNIFTYSLHSTDKYVNIKLEGQSAISCAKCFKRKAET